MKMTVVWGALVVVLVVAGALFAWRASAPTTVPDTTLSTPLPTAINQFTQQPTASPTTAVTTATPTATAPPAAATSGASITVDEQGFTPATLTIPVNTKVTFTNNGQGAHWPASDVHPTHEILPEFDAKRGLSTGETFSYTFTKAGTWAFHDHLFPRVKGTIIVE